jgi:pyruvate dehydrogenase (quinone)
MSGTVGDFFVRRLHEWGVRRIFGYPGDGINGVLGALQRAKGKIEFIQVRHEEMAAFMASAHAKFTGRIGRAPFDRSPGSTHLITGLYDAKAITCRFSRSPASAASGATSRVVSASLPRKTRTSDSVPSNRLDLKIASNAYY